MARRRIEFLEILLRGSDPSPALLGAFALGLVTFGVLGNLLFAATMAPATVLPVVWRPLVVIGGLLGVAYWLYRKDRRRLAGQVVVDESRRAQPQAGLIWLLGPGNTQHAQFAIAYHAKGEGTRHCWLVMQKDVPGVRDAFREVRQALTERNIATQLHPVLIERTEVGATYEAVRAVIEQEAGKEKVAREDLIADITGGTKPMTTGMALAALATGTKMEYLESPRDVDGYPRGLLQVVRVDVGFYGREGAGAAEPG